MFSTPAVLTGTVELDPVDRAAPLLPAQTDTRLQSRRRRSDLPGVRHLPGRRVPGRSHPGGARSSSRRRSSSTTQALADGSDRRLRAHPRLRRRSRPAASIRSRSTARRRTSIRRSRQAARTSARRRGRPTARSAASSTRSRACSSGTASIGNEHLVRAYELARPLVEERSELGDRARRVRARLPRRQLRRRAGPGSPRSVLRRVGEPAARLGLGEPAAVDPAGGAQPSRRQRRLEDGAGVRRLRSHEGGSRSLDRDAAERAPRHAPAERSRARRPRARGRERRRRRPQHAGAGQRARGAHEHR